MNVRDLLFPVDYFNLSESAHVVTNMLIPLVSIMTIVSIIYELINGENVLMPIKRAMFSIFLCAIIVPVLNFSVNTSFNIANKTLESLGDSQKLKLIEDPWGFYNEISKKQFNENSEQEMEVENINGVDFNVSQEKIKVGGLLADQVKNIPNVLFSFFAVGWIWACFIALEVSYYILYFLTGALFAIPAVMSIFPAFSSSITGAFKSLGVLFISPIVAAVLLALLSLKVGNITDSGAVTDSMKNVIVVIVLCTSLGSTILLSSGFLEASGISSNLGKVGAMATAMAGGVVTAGISKAIANKAEILSGGMRALGMAGQFARNPANFARNSASMIGNSVGNLFANSKSKSGLGGSIARGVSSLSGKASNAKDGALRTGSNAISKLKDKTAPSTSLGAKLTTAKAMLKSPEQFKETKEGINNISKMGIKSRLKPIGHTTDSLKNYNGYYASLKSSQNIPKQPSGWAVYNNKSRPNISLSNMKQMRESSAVKSANRGNGVMSRAHTDRSRAISSKQHESFKKKDNIPIKKPKEYQKTGTFKYEKSYWDSISPEHKRGIMRKYGIPADQMPHENKIYNSRY